MNLLHHPKLYPWLALNSAIALGAAEFAPTNEAAIATIAATTVITGVAGLLLPNEQVKEQYRYTGHAACAACKQFETGGPGYCMKVAGVPYAESRTQRLLTVPSALSVVSELIKHGCGFRNAVEGVRRTFDFGGEQKEP